MLAKLKKYDIMIVLCRCSSSVEHQLPKLGRRVRFPLSAVNLDFTRKTGCLLSKGSSPVFIFDTTFSFTTS